MNPKEEKKIRFTPAADAIRQLLEERQNTDAQILVAIDGTVEAGRPHWGNTLPTSLTATCSTWTIFTCGWNSGHRKE